MKLRLIGQLQGAFHFKWHRQRIQYLCRHIQLVRRLQFIFETMTVLFGDFFSEIVERYATKTAVGFQLRRRFFDKIDGGRSRRNNV